MGGTTSSYTYSPTPFGWGNGEQALKCTKRFPGGALNYVSGPCTIFFPYKVGRPLRPVTHFKRTWSKSAHFHVTAHSIPRCRPHRGRSCAGDGASGRYLTVARPPETHKDAGAAGGRGSRGPTANWRVQHAPKPARTAVPTPKSAVADWRVAPTARPGPCEARPSTAPLTGPLRPCASQEALRR